MSEAAAMEAVGDGSAGQPDQPAVVASAISSSPPPGPSPGTSPHQRPPLVQIQRPSEQEEGSDDDEISPVESAEFLTSEEDRDADRSVEGAELEFEEDQGQNTGAKKKNGANSENASKEWIPPDDTLKDKIIKQVEFYFSDANITKDAFLLKHVKRNKEGYVSIKLITSFKKVKSLTKDWRSVRYSLQQSSKLQVNAEGTKVKRRDPLPEYDDNCSSRTIVVANLPNNNPSIESINEQFKHCGEIALIRILRPGKPLPADIRKHMETHFEAQDKLCALVEFEQANAAIKAVKTMRGQDNWRSGLHVSILEEGNKKDKKKDKQQKKDQQKNNELSPKGFQQGGTPNGSDGGASGDADTEKKKRRRRRKKKGRVDELTVDNEVTGTPSSSDLDGDSCSPVPNRRQITRPSNAPHGASPSRLSPSTTPKSSPCASPHGSPRSQRKYRSPLANSSAGRDSAQRNSPRSSPRGSPEMSRKYLDNQSDGSGSNSSSPWVQRRRLLAAQEGLSPAGSPLVGRRSIDKGSLASPEGIVRLPRGPEECGGFYGGKGRGKPRSTTM
ncbi:la-related protein 6-like [Amphiura filiformis]|uniref:la-related protein 6-like n=1 Tax=Amphiura filiformis TaxID=82378 RepID=UPI003B21245C